MMSSCYLCLGDERRGETARRLGTATGRLGGVVLIPDVEVVAVQRLDPLAVDGTQLPLTARPTTATQPARSA